MIISLKNSEQQVLSQIQNLKIYTDYNSVNFADKDKERITYIYDTSEKANLVFKLISFEIEYAVLKNTNFLDLSMDKLEQLCIRHERDYDPNILEPITIK